VVESRDSQLRLAELRRTIDALAAAGGSPDPDLVRRVEEQVNALQAAGLGNGEQARLAALYHVSSVLGSSLQLAEVLNQVMDAVIQLTGAERGFLILSDTPGGDLRLQAARNLEGNRSTRTICRSAARSSSKCCVPDWVW
jgi:nitrate/nitrite-specific signal transduction histidine kinase